MNINDFFHPNSYIPRLTPIACALCVLIFLGLTLGGENMTWAESSRWGYFPPSAIWKGVPWSLMTSAFVHLEIWHLAFNVYWLWMLGNCLEDSIGPGRWLLFFLSAAWISGTLELLVSGDQGIGMSGVGYALFGFGWLARHKMPQFKALLSQQTIITFLLWLVGCALATFAGLANIANMAHLAGLAFGAAVAGTFVVRHRVLLVAPALALLVAASFVPLFWCPQSVEWTSERASQAHEKEDYAQAVFWYRRSLARGQEPSWVWTNLALIYHDSNKPEYFKAMKELRAVDAKAAQEIEAEYGPPTTP